MIKTTFPEEQIPPILDHLDQIGFVIFSRGLYNLNIVGVRNPQPTPNKFDDALFVIHKETDEDDNTIWAQYRFQATTDPGFYWLKNNKRKHGTAILCHPQQCRGAYKIDVHRGKYKALCQRLKPVWVWRDGDKDEELDMTGKMYKVNSGINIHRASQYFTSENVDRYSAGCTVIANPDDFDIFMDLCYKQITHGMGHKFTYTIIEGEY